MGNIENGKGDVVMLETNITIRAMVPSLTRNATRLLTGNTANVRKEQHNILQGKCLSTVLWYIISRLDTKWIRFEYHI